MLSMGIESMVAGQVITEDGIFYVSEVVVSAFQGEVCFNGPDSPCKDHLYYSYSKHKDLYVSVVINDDGGDTGYYVSDHSVYEGVAACEDGEEVCVYEVYDCPLDYRNSVYEAFFNIASNNAEALTRAYHSHVGTLDELEEDMEECGA